MSHLRHIILVGTALAFFYIGQLYYRSQVMQNCLASDVNKVICSNYIKIIDNKEWLLIGK